MVRVRVLTSVPEQVYDNDVTSAAALITLSYDTGSTYEIFVDRSYQHDTEVKDVHLLIDIKN